jgi:steroid 5-alpha reductase family enzyme
MELIWFTLLVSFAIQLTLFVSAFIFKTDKLTDLSYSMTFALLATILYSRSDQNILHLILLVMLLLWAFRLGIYLFIRINKIGKDARFDGIREYFFKFLRFWVLQGLVVWVVMLSSISFFANNEMSIGIYSIIGILIFSLGLIIETLADSSKYKFKNYNKNRGDFIRSGVWKYSRHPNYFGEFLIWVGILIYTLQGAFIWYNLLSPLFIFIVLYYGTGIPPLEKSYDKRFGTRKYYQAYKKQTNKFTFWFNKKS